MAAPDRRADDEGGGRVGVIVQPPDGNLLDAVIERAQHDLDEHDLGRLFRMVSLTWDTYLDEGYHRARTVALALVFQAARIRQRGDLDSRLADYLDRCAEACLIGWADEVAVQEAVTELAELDRLAPEDPLPESPVGR